MFGRKKSPEIHPLPFDGEREYSSKMAIAALERELAWAEENLPDLLEDVREDKEENR